MTGVQTCALPISLKTAETAGTFLEDSFSVKRFSLGLPVGITLTDPFFELLEKLSGRKTPDKYRLARSRLIDSYADGHKYLFEKKAVVYGEEDLVIAVASFLLEIGVIPALCASGARTGTLSRVLSEKAAAFDREITIREGVDFEQIAEEARHIGPDLMIDRKSVV